MPGPEIDLKQELFDAGTRLLKPPNSVDDLLALLNRVEHCLSFVEQQPPVGMQDALCPAFKALITKELIQHPDADVRAGVAAGLTEISRITAPDIPYNDEMMKDVFRITISAFEGLADNSSKSFGKRVSILETVSRVRSCAVLLDLECDGLLVEMFQNFYKCIRDFHAANVFTSMEGIMTLVIDECEEISNDLLFALLSVLKKENNASDKDASPIARKLGENVVKKCAARLKSRIVEAVKSLKINLLDYDFVVTLACQITPDHNPIGVPLMNGSESAAKTTEVVAQEVVPPSLPICVPSSGNAEAVEDAAHTLLTASDKPCLNAAQTLLSALDKPDLNVVIHPTENSQDVIEAGRDDTRPDTASKPESVPISESEPMSDKIAKRRGRKPKSVDIMQSDSGKLLWPDGNKAPSSSLMLKANIVAAAHEAPADESSAESDVLEKKSDSADQLLSPIVIENNAVTVESPSLSGSHGKSSPNRIRRSKKPKSTQEATSAHPTTEKKASGGSDDTEMRLVSSEKDAPDGVAHNASKSITFVNIKKEQGLEGDFEDNPVRQSDAQLGVADGTPRTKKRGRPRKDASMSAETRASSEGTSRKRPRRRFMPPEDGKEYGEELVGSRIKVWWPQDKVYYDGIVESFDPIRRKHKVLYTDNEREVLNLHREKWKLVKSGEGSEKGGVTGPFNAGDPSDTQEAKKLRADSSSVGLLGNSDSPPKKRRGRPPKNAVILPNFESAVKVGKPGNETKADEFKTVSIADAGNPIKPTDSVAELSALPNLNAVIETSEHDVLENCGSQVKQDSAAGAVVMNMVAPEAEIGLDMDEFSLERVVLIDDTQTDASEIPMPETGNLTEGGKSGPAAGPKSESSGTEIERRKWKAITSTDSMLPAVPGSADTFTKRPAKLLLGASEWECKDLSQRLGEPKVTSQNNSKSVVREVTFGSPTGLRFKFKTRVLEGIPPRKNDAGLPPELLNKDGSVKKPRGRPCKPKLEAPKPEGADNLREAVHPKADDSATIAKSEAEAIRNGEASLAVAPEVADPRSATKLLDFKDLNIKPDSR
uniref:Uncharacterized protein n=1 Tax=Kalanchoe fedtschenkoi TaxID=63787 RepID=A0A7N0TD51_KALFE